MVLGVTVWHKRAKEGRIVGRKYFVSFLFFYFVLTSGLCGFSIAQTSQDLSILRQWVNKDPFVYIGGKRLFDNTVFQNAFKNTVGHDIYKIFMGGYKGNKYFQSSTITETNGIMDIYVQDLSTDFYTSIYVNIAGGYIDVCWNGGPGIDKETHDVNAFITHDGRQFAVPFPECQDLSYGKIMGRISDKNKDKRGAVNAKEQNNAAYRNSSLKGQAGQENRGFIGTWEASYGAPASDGTKISVDRSVVIVGDPSVPSSLTFKLSDIKKIVEPGDKKFACTNSKLMSATIEGRVRTNVVGDYTDITLMNTKNINPACGQFASVTYRVKGGYLVEVVNGKDDIVLKRKY